MQCNRGRCGNWRKIAKERPMAGRRRPSLFLPARNLKPAPRSLRASHHGDGNLAGGHDWLANVGGWT